MGSLDAVPLVSAATMQTSCNRPNLEGHFDRSTLTASVKKFTALCAFLLYVDVYIKWLIAAEDEFDQKRKDLRCHHAHFCD